MSARVIRPIARLAYVLAMRRHVPLFLAVLALYAGGCDEPEAGEPCGGCIGGGTYKSYDEPPSSSGTASSYSRRVEETDAGISVSMADDDVDHGIIQLAVDGLHGNDLIVAYTPPTTAGTFLLEDLHAIATTSLMSERAFGTHVIGENGDVSVRFCTGNLSLCSANMLDEKWDVSLSGRRIVTGEFHSTPGGERLDCY